MIVCGKFINKKGYVEEVKHSNLEHRQVAYKEIYLKEKRKYPLPFSVYVVHHVDMNKCNNAVDNLELFTREEHEYLHGLMYSNPEKFGLCIDCFKPLKNKAYKRCFSCNSKKQLKEKKK